MDQNPYTQPHDFANSNVIERVEGQFINRSQNVVNVLYRSPQKNSQISFKNIKDTHAVEAIRHVVDESWHLSCVTLPFS